MQVRYWLAGLAVIAQTLIGQAVFAADGEVYHYGDTLDVARVISISTPHGCTVGEARMTYEDSKGEVHTLVYLQQGDDCVY
ncbi:MAG: DUF2790 domain-containing protein [Pseudomonas sp.]|uniref:DUF2790 domain-containing protein n=1 Tax=Pseudomonas sp. TaxID=306 RepID=UPI003D13DBA1